MLNATDAPVWLVSLLIFLVVGIPFFLLLYLGLRIVVSNLKSMGNIAKFSLLGLWLIAVIAMAVLSIRQASAHAFTGSVSETNPIVLANDSDSLLIRFSNADLEDEQGPVVGGMKVRYDEDENPILFSDDILLDVLKSSDSLMHIRIRKDADGSSMADARARAGQIDYDYTLGESVLDLNSHFSTASINKVRGQQVRITLYVPEGTKVSFDKSARYFIGRRTETKPGIGRRDIPDYHWQMQPDGSLKCQNCPTQLPISSSNGRNNRIRIDENGVDIDIKDENDSFRLKIDEEGIDIKANPDNRN
jgi:hypothetical protein